MPCGGMEGTEGITKTIVKQKYEESDLIQRIKMILLCHFIVGTAHASLAFIICHTQKSFEVVIFCLALVLSARRYIMFGNDFIYIHSKTFHRISLLLRYENIPCFQYFLVVADIVVLLYCTLQYIIEYKLQMHDQEMLMFFAYVLIPVIVLFVIYSAMEEKVVYKEILNPSVDIIEEFIPIVRPGENPNYGPNFGQQNFS